MVRSSIYIVSVVVALSAAAAVASAQGGSRTAPRPSQRSGESEAAKHNSILPEKSATGGGAQSSSGEAAQIERSAAPLRLSATQRQKIKSYFADKASQRLPSGSFSLSIGAAVPRQTRLRKLPAALISALGGFQGDDYVLVGHRLVVVDNNARRVVAIVPDVV